MAGQELCSNYPRCGGTTASVVVKERPGDPVVLLCDECADPVRLTAVRWVPLIELPR
jgi:hypothetical protein